MAAVLVKPVFKARPKEEEEEAAAGVLSSPVDPLLASWFEK